jgi:hypothetical protein
MAMEYKKRELQNYAHNTSCAHPSRKIPYTVEPKKELGISVLKRLDRWAIGRRNK